MFDAFKRSAGAAAANRQPRQTTASSAAATSAASVAAARHRREAVSPAVKASLLARSGRSGARQVKEFELAALLLAEPGARRAARRVLAELPFTDRSLDRLRHELLNLAASGFRLEKQGLENHLVRQGMAELVARLNARAVGGSDPADAADADAEDVDARFLQAASDLREMAEREPERARAMERFKNEGTEESWLDAQRLLRHRLRATRLGFENSGLSRLYIGALSDGMQRGDEDGD